MNFESRYKIFCESRGLPVTSHPLAVVREIGQLSAPFRIDDLLMILTARTVVVSRLTMCRTFADLEAAQMIQQDDGRYSKRE